MRNGTLSFEYRVDAERGFDFFSFEIDDVPQIARMSQQLTYVKVTYNIPVGMHVFKWKYSKDFSISYGDDAVFVRMIEVTGTAFADSACNPCQPGTFAPFDGSSTCTPCDANTKAPNPGATSCTSCAAGEFSYVGSAYCNTSAACTSGDVAFYYTACGSDSTRAKIYYWQQPKICNEALSLAYQKPSDEYGLVCAPCAPGYERNSQTGQCQGCRTNWYSTGGGSTCQQCPSGNAGRRDFIWSNFEELPDSNVPAAMGCDGECGTPGWRLAATYIDSGVGHGPYADSWFSLNLTVQSETTVSFNMSFYCNYLCYLSYVDNDVTGSNSTQPWLVQTRTMYSYFYNTATVYTISVPISPGSHQLSWHFSKFDGSDISRNDMARITGIQVRSVAAGQGGAAACQPCAAGQYVDSNTPYCLQTPPGTISGPLATSPTPCPPNTYAELPGSTRCLPCGHGTTSPGGSAWCDDSCTYRVSSDWNYDLKALSRVGGDMYGPVVDPNSRRNYYLNVCTREHTNATCVDDDDHALSTQACLVDPWGYGLDIGRLTNFWPHPTKPDAGVTIVYTNSTVDNSIPCRMWDFSVGRFISVPRTTNITFNCDPLAGYGSPVFVESGSTSCTFNFRWDSLFGCPTCDDSDMSYYYTDCINNQQYKTWQWKDNPRRCHDGMSLPTPVARPCTDSLSCPAGQYLLDECTDCPSGSFSLGGAKIINYWQVGASLPSPFVSIPSSAAGVNNRESFLELSFDGISIQTPPNYQAVQATFNFVEAGSVEFVYSSLVGLGYSVTFRLDFEPPVAVATHQSTFKHVVSVQPGTHLFTFNLTRTASASPLYSQTGYLRIYNVTAYGVSRAASQCTAALPGTYTVSASQPPVQCPTNTFQPEGGKTSCFPVPANKFAPAGASTTYSPPQCGYNDYDPVLNGPCSNGARNVNMVAKSPATCTTGAYRGGPLSVTCVCAPGYYFDSSGNCLACNPGQGWNENTRSCVTPPAGSVAANIYSLIKGKTSLPPSDPTFGGDKRDTDVQWHTTCQGKCVRAWGWTVDDLGFSLESGVQVGPSISTFSFRIPMSQPGMLSFTYRRYLGRYAPFKVMVDGVTMHTDTMPENTNSQSINIPLSGSAEHVISFVVTAQADQLAYSSTRLSDLTVSGASFGGAVVLPCPAGTASSGTSSCATCPAGTYAPAGSSECQACPANTFSAYAGSSTCSPCGANSFSEAGSSICQVQCSLNSTDGAFDWRDLPSVSAVLSATQRLLGYPDVTINACGGLTDCQGDTGLNAAYVCAFYPLVSTTSKVNYGTVMESYSRSVVQSRITMVFGKGDPCVTSTGLYRTSTLSLYCPSQASSFTPAPVVTRLDDCSIELSWYTPSACRACALSDYTPITSECVGRKQTVSYELLQDATCHDSEYTRPPSETKSCFQVGVSIGVVVGVIIALVGLVVSLVVFFVRHRKLSTEYQLLKDHAAGSFDDNENQFGVDEGDDDGNGITLDRVLDDDDDGLRLPTAQTSDENPHDDL